MSERELELRHCPFCSGGKPWVRSVDKPIFIECPSCGARGAGRSTLVGAVRSWNAAPRNTCADVVTVSHTDEPPFPDASGGFQVIDCRTQAERDHSQCLSIILSVDEAVVNATQEFCSCGGNPSDDPKACDACKIYHWIMDAYDPDRDGSWKQRIESQPTHTHVWQLVFVNTDGTARIKCACGSVIETVEDGWEVNDEGEGHGP